MLFITLCAFAILSLKRLYRSYSLERFIVAAFFASLACLTRYAGAAVILTGGAILLSAADGSFVRRCLRSFVFCGIAAVPLAVWMGWKQLQFGSPTVQQNEPPDSLSADLLANAHELGSWFVPPWIPVLASTALGLVLVTAIVVALVVALRRFVSGGTTTNSILPASSLILVNAFFALFYFVFISVMESTVFLDSDWGRLLSPLFISLLVTVLGFIGTLAWPSGISSRLALSAASVRHCWRGHFAKPSVRLATRSRMAPEAMLADDGRSRISSRASDLMRRAHLYIPTSRTLCMRWSA
ncbi:MAG: hypothetical protein ABR543_07440 [Gemmatimonadaceae bacterium]